MKTDQKKQSPFTKLADDLSCSFDSSELLWDAVKAFDPKSPEGLISLLSHSDNRVKLDGLFIFDELGKRGAICIDAAFKAAFEINSRESLAYFLSGVLSMQSSLRPEHIIYLLDNATKHDDVIRQNSMALVTSLGKEQLWATKDSFPKDTLHNRGLEALAFDQISSSDKTKISSTESELALFYQYCLLLLISEKECDLTLITALPDSMEDKQFMLEMVSRRLR